MLRSHYLCVLPPPFSRVPSPVTLFQPQLLPFAKQAYTHSVFLPLCMCLLASCLQMIELYLSGHLIIPNGTIHLFADGGNGVIDPSLYPLVRPGDGVYFHVAMESGACGLTLTPRSISFTGAEGTPKCKIGLGRGKDERVGVHWRHFDVATPLAHSLCFPCCGPPLAYTPCYVINTPLHLFLFRGVGFPFIRGCAGNCLQ